MTSPPDITQIIQSASKVKLPGGVVGKACWVLMVVAVAVALMAWVAGNVWVALTGIVLVSVLSFVTLWKLIGFADRNPQAALMEGAEFLVHEQMRFASKSHPQISGPGTELTAPPSAPMLPANSSSLNHTSEADIPPTA